MTKSMKQFHRKGTTCTCTEREEKRDDATISVIERHGMNLTHMRNGINDGLRKPLWKKTERLLRIWELCSYRDRTDTSKHHDNIQRCISKQACCAICFLDNDDGPGKKGMWEHHFCTHSGTMLARSHTSQALF
jgi:hypothetical protein